MRHVEIHGFAASTYVRTVRMVCIEKQVSYQLLPLEFQQPSHRALHPFLRMPVVRIGNDLLYETVAIATFVDEISGGPRLVPDRALDRARMLQWISTCSDYLYHDLVKALMTTDGVTEQALSTARRDLEITDGQLRHGPFLVGAEIYLCDLFLAPVIAYLENNPLGPDLLQGLTGLAGWRDRLWSRNSFTESRP